MKYKTYRDKLGDLQLEFHAYKSDQRKLYVQMGLIGVLLGVFTSLLISGSLGMWWEQQRTVTKFLSPLPDEPLQEATVSGQFKNVTIVRKAHAAEKSEKQQIFEYIVKKFGDDGANAITLIRKCENSAFNPEAENWNRNGTWDAGIMQINQVHGHSMEDMKDWKKNIDAGYEIYKRAGYKFTPWACAEVINQRPFYK